MDYQFFGLNSSPFEISSGQVNRYMVYPHVRKSLSRLIDAVTNRRALMLLSGPVGIGKTALCHFFVYCLKRLSSEKYEQLNITVDPVWLPEPPDTGAELLQVVAHRLGVTLPEGTRLDRLQTLQDGLAEYTAEGKRLLLIMDEAQFASDDMLDRIRALSNMEHEGKKLLHILLVGQDGLVERLTSETQNALYQRISCRVFLRRMDTDLVRDFIRFRLERAGAKDNCFDPLAIEMITIASDGIPRLVNMICNAALVEAYEDDSAQVQPSHVFAATRELGIDNEHISIMYDELYDKNPKEAIDDYMFREKFETGASEGQRKLLWTMRK